MHHKIRGIAGPFKTDIYTVTIQWEVTDDDSKVHTIHLPNFFYIPKAPHKLLSPQHWATVALDNKP